jgi:hypothetical protein
MVIQTHVLDNGVTIVYEKSYTTTPITSLYVLCDLGSIHEPKHLKGASHMIEHMCFKGNRKIPSSKDILDEYSNIGAQFNAFTSKRYTCYYLRAQDIYTKNCIQIMADMLLESTFKSQEFQKEERVVIEENVKIGDDPKTSMDKWKNEMIYKGSSYEFPVDDIEFHKPLFSCKEVFDFYKAFYQPSRIVISIVSNISFEHILKMIQNTTFSKKQKECISVEKYKINYQIPVQNGIQYKRVTDANKHTILLMISFRTCNQNSTDKYCLEMLNGILSRNLSGRMSFLLREDNGLTYVSNADNTHYEHSGDFTLYAQMDKTKILKNGKKQGVLPLLVAMLNNLYQKGVTASEVKTSKTNMKGNQVFGSEDNSNQAMSNGEKWLLYQTLVPSSQIYDTYYKKIEKEDINEVIRKYFRKTNMNVILYGDQIPALQTIQTECEKYVG